MKTATIPFPRQFGPGAEGIDVTAVKRAMKNWAVHYSDPKWTLGSKITTTRQFGDVAQRTLTEFKRRHKLLADPIYTDQAHEKLHGFFDAYGASLMNKAYVALAKQKLRDSYVRALSWGVIHHGQFRYAEVRPIPESLPPFTSGSIVTDCSGWVTLAAKWTPGCPDPNGLNFDGAGNTGTLMAHGKPITAAQVRPGDLVIYRAGSRDGYGHHAAAVVEVLNGDFRIVSNGHGGDPGYYLNSAMAHEQAVDFGAYEAVFRSFLP